MSLQYLLIHFPNTYCNHTLLLSNTYPLRVTHYSLSKYVTSDPIGSDLILARSECILCESLINPLSKY